MNPKHPPDFDYFLEEDPLSASWPYSDECFHLEDVLEVVNEKWTPLFGQRSGFVKWIVPEAGSC